MRHPRFGTTIIKRGQEERGGLTVQRVLLSVGRPFLDGARGEKGQQRVLRLLASHIERGAS